MDDKRVVKVVPAEWRWRIRKTLYTKNFCDGFI